MCYVCRMLDSARSIRLPDNMWNKMRRLAHAHERNHDDEEAVFMAVNEYRDGPA